MSTVSLDGLAILVVEDDYMIAQDIRDALQQAGATVLGPVPSVRKALRLIESEARLDAAVLDVNLGDEKSFPIAEVLELKAVPFLFATGYNSADIPDEWRRAPIMMKPFRIEMLAQLLVETGSH